MSKLIRYVCAQCNNSFYFNDGVDRDVCAACNGKLIKQKSLIETDMTIPEPEKEYYSAANNDYWLALETSYLEYEQKANEYAKLRDETRQKLIEESNGLNIEGNKIRLAHINSRGSVQYELIPELKDIDLDQYRKPSRLTQRITVIKDASATT